MAKPFGRPGRDGKGKRPGFGAKRAPAPIGKKPSPGAKHAPVGKKPGQAATHAPAGRPLRRPARDDDSEVPDRDDNSEVSDRDDADERPVARGRDRAGGKGADDRNRAPAGKGSRPSRDKAAAPDRGVRPGRGTKPTASEPLTFRSERNKQVDPKGAVELKPFTGVVRESQVIRVQPMARAAKGSQEILFGRIARDCGFVNQKALDRCVQAQKEDSTGGRKFLGDILVDEELLSRMEVDEIIKIQHRNLQKRYKYSGEKQEQALFGRLIVKKELATKEQVNECIRWQAEMERFNEKVPLGELLIAKGYVQDAGVEAVLRLQAKGRAKREAQAASGEHATDPPPKPSVATEGRAKKRAKRAPLEDAAPLKVAAPPEDAAPDDEAAEGDDGAPDAPANRDAARAKRKGDAVRSAAKPKADADAPVRPTRHAESASGVHAASASGVRAASASGVRAASASGVRAAPASGVHAGSAPGVRAAPGADASGSGVRAASGEKARALESAASLEALGGEAKKVAPQAVIKGWYMGLLGRAYGPLPRRLVATLFEAGALGPDDLFWHQDLDGWHTARFIEEFSAYLPVGSVFTSAGGPPLPLQAKSPKALAESFDALRDSGVLEDADHLKLRKLLTQPFAG